MDAICSSFTPQSPIKELGGLICPGTVTGPQAQEREREREILPTPEWAARTLADTNCCRVGLRAREHTGLPQPLASKQASKQERDADRGIGTDGLRHRRGTETGPADECHKACVQMYGAAIDAAETPKSVNSKLLKPQTSIRGG